MFVLPVTKKLLISYAYALSYEISKSKKVVNFYVHISPIFSCRVTYNVRLFNSSPAVVVLIGRLMHGIMSIAPPSLRYKIQGGVYVHIRMIV